MQYIQINLIKNGRPGRPFFIMHGSGLLDCKRDCSTSVGVAGLTGRGGHRVGPGTVLAGIDRIGIGVFPIRGSRAVGGQLGIVSGGQHRADRSVADRVALAVLHQGRDGDPLSVDVGGLIGRDGDDQLAGGRWGGRDRRGRGGRRRGD